MSDFPAPKQSAWSRYVSRNPQIATCRVAFSPKQFKEFFDKLYDEAYEAGRSEGVGEALMVRLFDGDKGGNR